MCTQLPTLSFPQGSPGEATHKGHCALEVTDYDTEQGHEIPGENCWGRGPDMFSVASLVLLSCKAGWGQEGGGEDLPKEVPEGRSHRSVLTSSLDDLLSLSLSTCPLHLYREVRGQENLTTRFLGIPQARKALSIPLKGLAGTAGLKESR